METFAPVLFDIDVNISFGDIRRAWIDVSSNFVTVNFKSDGFLRYEGFLPDMKDVDYLFRPDGVMAFHTPAEHSFGDKGKYDCELQIYFHDFNGERAIVSVFFDREAGGRRSNNFFESMVGLESNETGKENAFSGLLL
jgi:hypothetical protein